jgi:hypothetical protein
MDTQEMLTQRLILLLEKKQNILKSLLIASSIEECFHLQRQHNNLQGSLKSIDDEINFLTSLLSSSETKI